ncbi:MAG: exosortase Q [Betaproteobacteria bacterium]|nr:MAG: exosortase Q [Betaproteobacteria bacterium]
MDHPLRPSAAPFEGATAADRQSRIRGVRLAPLGWLALQAAALWPHGRWMWQRATDGSDDPLGLAALAVLALLAVRVAPRLRVLPRLPWLGASALFTLAATAALWGAPPLLGALLAALALAAALAAWLPDDVAWLPPAGLLLLTLPLISSLQFYAGYPLRALTAEASAWLLNLVDIAAERSGASMLVRGHLVIVDAPCSGVQLAWMAYFAACATAALSGLANGTFLRRLPWAGPLALLGNIVRNTTLVGLESRAQGLSPLAHEAIGLLALATVCVLVIALMRGGRHAAR